MSLRFGLIGVFLAPEHVGYCFYHDADVEQESPVLNIPQVSSYPAFHLGKFLGFSPVAGDLRPSGNSGFDKVAHHVFVNQLGIFLCMFQHMWGLGPTMDISPLNTLMNCGSSSRLLLRRKLPNLVLRGSFLVACNESDNAFTFMERNL